MGIMAAGAHAGCNRLMDRLALKVRLIMAGEADARHALRENDAPFISGMTLALGRFMAGSTAHAYCGMNALILLFEFGMACCTRAVLRGTGMRKEVFGRESDETEKKQ